MHMPPHPLNLTARYHTLILAFLDLGPPGTLRRLQPHLIEGIATALGL